MLDLLGLDCLFEVPVCVVFFSHLWLIGVIRFPVLRPVIVDSTTPIAVSVCWLSSAISEKIILPTLISALGYTNNARLRRSRNLHYCITVCRINVACGLAEHGSVGSSVACLIEYELLCSYEFDWFLFRRLKVPVKKILIFSCEDFR